jgi:two-component system sensor histidine kinase HupT/HoxJ
MQSHRLRTRERQISATFGGMAKQEKLAMLGHMLTGIAHELHTPLGAVSCALDTRKRAAAKLAEALGEIENGSDTAAAADRAGKALDIIRSTDPVLDEAIGRTRELLAELKSAGRGERTEPVPVNVNALIDGALLLLRHELKQETEVVTEYGDLPEIPGFPGGMGQIFLNLILNGSQAMDGPGTLTITSSVEGERALVRVRDTGPGLPHGCAENLFQAGWTSKPEGEGTGLGLFISQRIADRHGGVISARNHPDGGAEFTVSLPLTGPVVTAGA